MKKKKKIRAAVGPDDWEDCAVLLLVGCGVPDIYSIIIVAVCLRTVPEALSSTVGGGGDASHWSVGRVIRRVNRRPTLRPPSCDKSPPTDDSDTRAATYKKKNTQTNTCEKNNMPSDRDGKKWRCRIINIICGEKAPGYKTREKIIFLAMIINININIYWL